ncbi:MAG: winged helix-turn-helix transcriptional regulator [Ardenticatenaceae bacterium]|nr:winged helix-turn-helix transcriptional regulator [Ardenticatenaceae bacterium]
MELKTIETAQQQADICAVFANYRRVLILWTLVEQEKSVSDIATAVHASLQSTSQHLHLMKDKGILQSRRDGQTVYYRIANHDTLAKCPLLIETRRNQLAKHNQNK